MGNPFTSNRRWGEVSSLSRERRVANSGRGATGKAAAERRSAARRDALAPPYLLAVVRRSCLSPFLRHPAHHFHSHPVKPAKANSSERQTNRPGQSAQA